MAQTSRQSPASTVFRELLRTAAPQQSSSCVRLWISSPCSDATQLGDGYELLLLNELMQETIRPIQEYQLQYQLQSGQEQQNQQQQQKQEPQEQDGIRLLIEVRSSPSSCWIRESLILSCRLQVGDCVDAQDSTLQWYEAVVREITQDTIKVHYFGWNSKWDMILPRYPSQSQKLLPPAPLWSKTSPWRTMIQIGDQIEIRQSSSLVHRPKWYHGKVVAVGQETDHPRILKDGAELETLDGVPYRMMNRKRQILVEVPEEIHHAPNPPPPNIPNEHGQPTAQPPFVRWVDLYGEEICQSGTHISEKKKGPATVSYAVDSQRQPVEIMKSHNDVHGAGFIRESLRGVPPAPGSVGLHNLGNSCYLNSILQCINHIGPITKYFLKGDYLKDINKNNPLGSGGMVATAYASFLNDMWTGEYSILAPRLLKQTVGSFAPQFNNNHQHDSQEFCQFLMDGLHEDLNRVKNKPYVEHTEANGMDDNEAAMESWRKHLLRHDSVIVDHTQGMHRSHLTCPTCGKESIKFDVYSSISLPLAEAKSGHPIPLEDCLDKFAAGEQLDEHNAWYCSRCQKHVCALKLITLWNTPDILILHLKRFTFEKSNGKLLRSKIKETVTFPIDRLDLTQYVLGPKDPEAPPVYKLFGVSEHSGTTANSGHYSATVRNSLDGKWYRYNDSHVGGTTGDAAVTGGAYLLFYQRVKGSLRWAGMEKQMLQRGVNPFGSAEEDIDGFREVKGKKKKKKG